MSISEISKIIKEECSYKKINSNSKCQMRNRKDGIQLMDALWYRFQYADKNMTKDRAVAKMNIMNGTTFSRQSFDSKEQNIPLDIYMAILKRIINHYNDKYNDANEDIKVIAIDGTYNNDIHMNEMLNMGFYDITNGIPVNIVNYGKQNKNREVSSAINHINKNMATFKNTIIVADRAYFSYDFLKFLIDNGIQFIIRARGDAKNLDPTTTIRRSMAKYGIINDIKHSIRIVKLDNIMKKTVYASNSKKSMKTHQLEVQNDCVLITNIPMDESYTDAKILELYRSRWDIEVFFKYLKSNFKFQHIMETEVANYKKMYVCEMIITYITRIVEKHYRERVTLKNKPGTSYKVNMSNMVSGMFDFMIHNIIYDKLTDQLLDQFCSNYIIIVRNRLNRSFPRTSKKPFTKWYIKGYSNQTRFMRIVEAVINNTVDELNKNDKMIARKIKKIDGVEYNGNT